MRHPTFAILSVALASLLPLAAVAATPIDETRPLDARGKVEISNVQGSIKVRVWDKPSVHIGGMLGKGVESFDIRGGRGDDAGELSIEVKYPHGMNDRNTEPTHLVIDVPRLASLDIDGVSADIDVNGTAGKSLEINSVSGQVTVAGAPSTADIESVSGDLRLTLNSADVEAQTVSGGLQLRGRLTGEAKVETVSGSILVDSRGERLREVSAETVSGSADFRIALADGATFKSESVSGDITLRVPKTLSAQVTATSFSGDLNAPGANVKKEKYGPGSSLDQRYGSGSGNVHIETFSGSATLELN